MQYPMLEVDKGRQPPFTIWLAPWAVTAAEELHRQFGDNAELTVGALPYPAGRQLQRPPAIDSTLGLLDTHEMMVQLDGPAVVSSRHTLRHGLLLRNFSDRELQVATTVRLPSSICRPARKWEDYPARSVSR